MSCPSCHFSTFYGSCMHVQVQKGSLHNFLWVYFLKWFVLSVTLCWYINKAKGQNSLSTNKSTVLVIHLHYISLGVLLVCLGKVNECSLSLHNHVALFQLSAVLFWCVSLFPVVRPSNQLRSISDFLSSPIN